MKIRIAVNEKGYRIGEDHPHARYTNSEIGHGWLCGTRGKVTGSSARLWICLSQPWRVFARQPGAASAQPITRR